MLLLLAEIIASPVISPAIGAGDSTYYNTGQTPDLSAVTTDLDGHQRIFGTGIDMGPYEYGSVVPLPITLIQFRAIAEGQKAKLEWTTASEKNNWGFIISRSSDGKNFKEIGKTAAENQSNSPKDYVYYDEQPQNGRNFYRLQQLDFDGKITLSGIRMVQFSTGKNALSIFPNPVNGTLEVAFTAGSFQTLELCDITGKIEQVKSISAQTNRLKLDFKNLPVGIYFLRLMGKGNTEVRKVIHE